VLLLSIDKDVLVSEWTSYLVSLTSCIGVWGQICVLEGNIIQDNSQQIQKALTKCLFSYISVMLTGNSWNCVLESSSGQGCYCRIVSLKLTSWGHTNKTVWNTISLHSGHTHTHTQSRLTQRRLGLIFGRNSVKLWRMSWSVCSARMEKTDSWNTFWLENLMNRDNIWSRDISFRITLKLVSGKWTVGMWSGLKWFWVECRGRIVVTSVTFVSHNKFLLSPWLWNPEYTNCQLLFIQRYKLNLSLGLTKHDAMKTYGGDEV